MERTPIELLDDVLMKSSPLNIVVNRVLVPEQCMSVFIGDKEYHITMEFVPERDEAWESEDRLRKMESGWKGDEVEDAPFDDGRG
jgi:hypothetical protein